MATVNKNFRIKNGLVVEGSTATVNGQNILTETGSDQYILNLIGGETLVKSVSSDFAVDSSGNLTINGSSDLARTGDITTAINALSTDDIEEGANNKYYVKGTAEADIGAFLSNASKTNISITYDPVSGLDITAENGVADSTTDDLDEGTTNKYFTDGRAVTAVSNVLGSGLFYSPTGSTIDVQLGTGLHLDGSNNVEINRSTVDTWYDASGAASTAEGNANNYTDNAIDALTTKDVAEDQDYLYFTEQRVEDAVKNPGTGILFPTASSGWVAVQLDPTFDSLAVPATDLSGKQDVLTASTGITIDGSNNISVTSNTYDAYGAASTAEGNANTYTDNAIDALTTDDIPEGNQPPFGQGRLYFTDNRAVTAVTNVLGTGLTTDAGTGNIIVDTNNIATQTYVNNAIDNLVDGAPGLLDTLNEIAAAINDDANYFTTIANEIAGKQNTLTAGSNISIDGSNVISVTGLDTDDVSEGSNLYFTDARARDAVDGTNRSFTSVAINEVAKQVAATTGNIVTAAATTALSWAKADYRSGKFTVKVKNGSHTEISEILVTLDTSDNVAITEYGIVGTNGSLGTVSADVSGSDVRIRVTPANNNSEVMVVGTLLI